MALFEFRRALAAFLLFSIIASDAQFHGLDNVIIEVFEPKGFRASIKDVPNLALFAIQGLAIRAGRTIDVLGETASSIETGNDRFWVVDLPDIHLEVGDEVNYLAFAAVDTSGYVKDSITHKVGGLIPFVPLNRSSNMNPWKVCEPTVTRVRQGSVCAGQTIFEEHFDFLRNDIWEVQQYVPIDHPEFPFVSYQPSAVSVKDGKLRIVPLLQQAQSGYSQSNTSLYTQLDLKDGCSKEQDEACLIKVENGHTIVPPVISGRLMSKSGFAFTYGTISIRAKLPQGDWIYPELLLEPLMNKFTRRTHNSGVLKIACARGNKELNKGSTQYGNKVLYSGPVIDEGCHDNLLNTKNSSQSWGDSFHVYSVKWTKESLIFSVDGEEYATVKPEQPKGLRSMLRENCRQTESGIMPFEDLFYITLGLAVGGRSEFPDAAVSKDNHVKPWKNAATKAAIHFWKDSNAWHSTWQQPELLIDYVKVVAL